MKLFNASITKTDSFITLINMQINYLFIYYSSKGGIGFGCKNSGNSEDDK